MPINNKPTDAWPHAWAERREVLAQVSKIEALPGYQMTEPMLELLTDEAAAMCGSMERFRWLVKRALQCSTRRPTPVELRRLLLQRFPAADGIEAADIDIGDAIPERGVYTR